LFLRISGLSKLSPGRIKLFPWWSGHGFRPVSGLGPGQGSRTGKLPLAPLGYRNLREAVSSPLMDLAEPGIAPED
jgi:hypothetical protein